MSDLTIGNVMRVLSLLDTVIQNQLNQILHHVLFQRLEARWRALHFMVMTVVEASPICVRLLCLNEQTLQRDLYHAVDFDQSLLFKKIYTDEYDQPGGKPFGLLIADYEFALDTQGVWLRCLKVLADIAALAFTPVVIGVAASFFGLENFTQFTSDINLARFFAEEPYHHWHALRRDEALRFIYAAAPRVLWRIPYQHSASFLRNDGFTETLTSIDDYLWGNPAYIIAVLVMRSYVQTKWFLELCEQNLLLQPFYFSMDTQKLMPISRLEASFTDSMERALVQQGFMALVESPYHYSIELRASDSVYCADIAEKVQHADVRSTALPYVLSLCRFAHYLKIIARDKMGGFASSHDMEQCLKQWIFKYCGKVDQDALFAQAYYPLEYADITVFDDMRRPGYYFCNVALKPNAYVDNSTTRLQFFIGQHG